MARLPDQIGKYNVVERIGKGGMGMVYKAEHPTLDRAVILKKLNISGDPVMRERFRREAEIMIDFRTDYVVDVYDHFRHGSSDYIVLEYIDGVSLDELLANERYLESDLALFLVRDCLRGLAYVHGKGVVHRDVKPGNVLIGRDGSVKLLDFGIASKVTGFDDELTREGMTLGTVAYIAPEQIERSREVDRRADIYSTGAMLYEMVTGRKAFSGGFTAETVTRIQRGKYKSPRRVNPRVSRLASRIVRRCMKRLPRRRFQSADAVVTILDRYFARRGEEGLRERLAELAGGPAASGKAPRRRRRWGRLAVAAGVLVLAGVTAGWLTGGVQRLLLGRTHALAQYELRLRKGDRELREHLVRTELERFDDGAFVPVPVPLPMLREARALETPDYTVLRSRPLTLPAGRYRVTLRVEELVQRALVSLEPVALAGEIRMLAVQWDPVPRERVRLTVDPRDAATGDPVAGVRVEALLDGRWLPIVRRGVSWFVLGGSFSAGVARDEPSADAGSTPFVVTQRAGSREVVIAPGDRVDLRLSHPDYLTSEVSVEAGARVEALAARVALVPRPARLLVNSRLDEAELLVNDATRVVAPGGEPVLVDLPPLLAGVTEVELEPGAYEIEVRADGAVDSVQVTLAPGGQATLRLEETSSGELSLVVVEEVP